MKLKTSINNYKVIKLGKCKVKSPLRLSTVYGDQVVNYVPDDEKILYDISLKHFLGFKKSEAVPAAFVKAGPRENIFFEPAKTKAAIVTCGGLCPGLNNVIRGLVMQLYYRYGVKQIIGIRYGYQGFIPKYNHPVMKLTPEKVTNIYLWGGTILGTSRGKQNISEIVDSLRQMKVDILFTIGGDGTLKGAQAITEEITRRKLRIAVTGIPKTIDNDIGYTEKSFGFESAFSVASLVIRSMHNEAAAAYNGIALVKLMGRDSGYIAAHAALSMPEVNFVLIPEMEFDLPGEKGLLEVLKRRLLKKKHALIVISEGAGQFLFRGKPVERDASGNVKYQDIGLYFKKEIAKYFKKQNIPITIKYIDPGYLIRSVPAIPDDSKFCMLLAQNAVHGAMAGKSGFMVGILHHQFVYIPMALAVKERKRIDLESELWLNVLESTGQPVSMKN